MTDREQNEPDWSCLPHDPESFFGLAGEYSRKDLKRRYNQLIRIYKPERAPEEFQRIRAAFEQLDNALRYGERIERSVLPSNLFDWAATAAAEAAPETPEPDSGATPRRYPNQKGRPSDASETAKKPPRVRPPHEIVLEQIRSKGARAVYDDLTRREQRTPFDYFSLAILSDIVNDDPLKFVKWLLAGLKEYAEEPGLLSLLYSNIRGTIADDAIPSVLAATARTVRTDRFYSLTEPLWDRLLRQRPFEEFRRLLGKCESELQDFRVEGRIAFYLHLLRRALWFAPADWVDEIFEFLDENQPHISPMDDFELEFLSVLRDYVASRDGFLNGDGLRYQMDKAVRHYCLLPEPENDHAFIECQIRIASNGDDVLRGFPFGPDSDDGTLQILWEWISADVRDRLPDHPDDRPRIEEDDDGFEQNPDMRKRARRVRAFLFSVEARTDASGLGQLWNVMGTIVGILSGGLIYLLLFIPLFLGLPFVSDLNAAIAFGVALVFAGVVGTLSRKKWLPALWGKICLSMAMRCYRRIWRREVQQYLRRSRLTVHEFISTVEAVTTDQMPASTWLMHIVYRDGAQHLFVTAQRYLA